MTDDLNEQAAEETTTGTEVESDEATEATEAVTGDEPAADAEAEAEETSGGEG